MFDNCLCAVNHVIYLCETKYEMEIRNLVHVLSNNKFANVRTLVIDWDIIVMVLSLKNKFLQNFYNYDTAGRKMIHYLIIIVFVMYFSYLQ